MKFKTGGKTYTASALTRPSIRDYLTLARETEDLGRKWTSADVFALEQEIAACKTDAERAANPDLLMFLAFIVWATMIEAGDPDPFARAIDTRLDDLDFLPDPADHKVASDPSKPRAARASARGARRPRTTAAASARTSKIPSTDES